MEIISVKQHKLKFSNELNGYILTTGDGLIYHVPHDEENRHYQAILEWETEGNTIEEAD